MRAKCKKCGTDLELPAPNPEWDKYIKDFINNAANEVLCDDCHKAEMDRQYSAVDDERRRGLIKESLLPEEWIPWARDKGKIDMMRFVWGNRHGSLILTDKTGTNKTRCLVAACAKLINAEFVKVRFWRSVKLAQEIASIAGNSMSAMRELTNELSGVELLILDDFGKERVTDRVEEVFFSIIDTRYVKSMGTWLSTEDSIDDLRGHFQFGRGPAIIRRLKSMCVQWNCGTITEACDE